MFRVRFSRQPSALVLTWNPTRTLSAVLEVELGKFTIKPLVEVQTSPEQPKAMLNLFELVHGYLMVANLYGFVSIYNYPDTTAKVGGIYHQNPISDIVPSEQELKNTSLHMKIVFILEKKTEQKEGSLAVYLLK